MKPLIVQKYGGSSVADVEKIRHVAEHIKQTSLAGNSVVVVISAMGATTDDLLELANAVSSKPNLREVDMLLTAGERISMSLLSIALSDLGVRCRSFTGSQSGIITDEVHGNARIQRILGDRIRSSIAADEVVIVAGFQGVCAASKEITTLGRGGSDLTAISLSYALSASKCEIYKDVDGVYTANPRQVSCARKLANISWQEMSALCWGGSEVLHARSLHVAERFKISMELKSSIDTTIPGTLIQGGTEMESFVLSALTHKNHMLFVSFECSKEHSLQAMDAISEFLWSSGETPMYRAVHAASDLDTSVIQLLISESNLKDLLTFASNHPRMNSAKIKMVSKQPNLCAITIVGQGLSQAPELAGLIADKLGYLRCEGVEFRSHSVLIMVDQKTSTKAITVLHELISKP